MSSSYLSVKNGIDASFNQWVPKSLGQGIVPSFVYSWLLSQEDHAMPQDQAKHQTTPGHAGNMPSRGEAHTKVTLPFRCFLVMFFAALHSILCGGMRERSLPHTQRHEERWTD